MKRRNFLKLICASPLAGWVKAKGSQGRPPLTDGQCVKALNDMPLSLRISNIRVPKGVSCDDECLKERIAAFLSEENLLLKDVPIVSGRGKLPAVWRNRLK